MNEARNCRITIQVKHKIRNYCIPKNNPSETPKKSPRRRIVFNNMARNKK